MNRPSDMDDFEEQEAYEELENLLWLMNGP